MRSEAFILECKNDFVNIYLASGWLNCELFIYENDLGPEIMKIALFDVTRKVMTLEHKENDIRRYKPMMKWIVNIFRKDKVFDAPVYKGLWKSFLYMIDGTRSGGILASAEKIINDINIPYYRTVAELRFCHQFFKIWKTQLKRTQFSKNIAKGEFLCSDMSLGCPQIVESLLFALSTKRYCTKTEISQHRIASFLQFERCLVSLSTMEMKKAAIDLIHLILHFADEFFEANCTKYDNELWHLSFCHAAFEKMFDKRDYYRSYLCTVINYIYNGVKIAWDTFGFDTDLEYEQLKFESMEDHSPAEIESDTEWNIDIEMRLEKKECLAHVKKRKKKQKNEQNHSKQKPITHYFKKQVCVYVVESVLSFFFSFSFSFLFLF